MSRKLALLASSNYLIRMISPMQIRAARALINISRAELAVAADISSTALANIERKESDPRSSTLQRIQAALEARGVMFGPSNSVGLQQSDPMRDSGPTI